MLGAEDLRTVQARADIATIGILQERVVAFIHTVNMDGAFNLLRQYARSNSLPLNEVAERIVNRSLSL